MKEPRTVTLSITDSLATITLNRPAQMNTFNDGMAEDLARVTEAVAQDSSVRAVLLRGAGKVFMAGGDLSYFHSNLETMPEGTLRTVRLLNASILNLQAISQPIVASVHGSVAGVGLSLMAGADLIIASEETKFTTAYGNIGLSPDGGASHFLPRLIGPRKAMELLLLPEIFGASQALEMGLINQVVKAEEFQEATHQLLKRLVRGPKEAMARTKQLLKESWNRTLVEQLEKEAYHFTDCTASDEFREGVTAFLEKRHPEF